MAELYLCAFGIVKASGRWNVGTFEGFLLAINSAVSMVLFQ